MGGRKEEAIVTSLAVLRPVERVWAALTSSRDLGLLLLGRVEMQAQPGAPLRWPWGVWEKVAPKRKGGYTWVGKVLDVVPGSTLVLGPTPLVIFTVKGEGDSALVTVAQSAPRPPEKAEDYEYGWADFLLRLKINLETEHTQREVLARALVRAKPEQIYRGLLSPAALAKILPGKAKVQAKAGGRFSWQHKRSEHAHTGAFLELRKGRRMSFTWERTNPASEVVIEAQPMPYGTLVSVHHTGLVRMNPGQLFGQRMYWWRLLERLRCYFYFKGNIRTAD